MYNLLDTSHTWIPTKRREAYMYEDQLMKSKVIYLGAARLSSGPPPTVELSMNYPCMFKVVLIALP